jgi:serine-type D-Ala-D-Ala carboxypeptidase/endopeptidase (penicillin-binding protein 4)
LGKLKLKYCVLAILYLFFCWASPIEARTGKYKPFARNNPPSRIQGKSALFNEINSAIHNSKLNAYVAVYIKSMKGSETLYTRNIYRPLIPASTLKIFTAEAALLYLGSDYHFSTQLLTDAKGVKNGILQGNLYIVLSGDPSLTYYDLADLLVSLKTQQIHAIAGNVYIDNSAYDQRFYGPGWEWKDKTYCWAAPISASIINHNCLSFKVTPSKIAGRNAAVITSPNSFYPVINNGVTTKAARSRRNCALRLSSSNGSTISIDGCMPRNQAAWGISYVVANIPEYNRALFKSLFKQLFINVYGTVTFGSAPNHLSLIGQHASKPLPVLINEMLKKSDNIIAGALFKKLGQLYSHQPGSWENGSLAVSRILAKEAGLNAYGLRILDGSGISHGNLATAAQMMQILDFAYHHYPSSNEFISALPISGIDGTLKNRMHNIVRKVRAKTGTISGVASLAGYVIDADQEPLAFVIMINGDKRFSWRYKPLEDKIATLLTKYKN